MTRQPMRLRARKPMVLIRARQPMGLRTRASSHKYRYTLPLSISLVAITESDGKETKEDNTGTAIQFPKLEEMRRCYREELKNEKYLAEKTEGTILTYTQIGKKFKPTVVDTIASFALDDLYAYQNTSVASGINKEMMFKSITQALRKCSRPV